MHNHHDHERRLKQWNKEFAYGSIKMVQFAEKMEKTRKRGRILWISTLSLWVLFAIMMILITAGNQPYVGVIVFSVIFAFPLLLLGVANFVYPWEFWWRAHSFNWHIKGGGPTNFGIATHMYSGIFSVICIFGLGVLLSLLAIS